MSKISKIIKYFNVIGSTKNTINTGLIDTLNWINFSVVLKSVLHKIGYIV